MSRRASGLHAWFLQRVSAVYIGFFVLILLARLWLVPPADVDAWRQWVASPLVSVGFALLIPCLALHAWVGVRDVILDYVHPLGWRLLMLSLAAFYLLAVSAWALFALERLS